MGGSDRLALSLEVLATVAGFPKPIPATLVDLSPTGCRLHAGSILLVGATIEFRIPLSGRNSVMAHGKIGRCIPTEVNGTLEYGVEFGPFAANEARDLQAFVAEECRRDSSALRAARVETEFPLEVIGAGQKNGTAAVAIDIGRGGMRIASEHPLPEGSTVTLHFALPASDRKMSLRGRVLQRKHVFREHHHNVVFVEPDPNDIDRIDHFMRSQG